MNEIKRPIIKSADSQGKWKELIRFLYEMIDNLNWNLQTLENSVNWQKKKLIGVTFDEEATAKSDTETELCTAKFKKAGKTVAVILNCYLGEGAPSKGTANISLPVNFTPSFFDSAVPIAKSGEITCYLQLNKITIDYDFSGESKKSSVYFQYIS